MDILQMVKEAQSKLRATQINWQEECLFDCDDILTGVIRELEQRPTKDAAGLSDVLAHLPKSPKTGKPLFPNARSRNRV